MPDIPVTGIAIWRGILECPPHIMEQLLEAGRKQHNVPDTGPARLTPKMVFEDFPECLEYSEYVQELWMQCLAEYMDLYDEVVWNIQWQEASQFVRYIPGKELGFHADTKTVKIDGLISRMPHRRNVTSLIYVNDNYEGGILEWKYHNVRWKPGAGDLVMYPSNFLYAHRSTPLLTGEKLAFLTSFCTGELPNDEYGDYLR